MSQAKMMTFDFSTKKVFGGLFVVTLGLLLYVHTQVLIFQTSYAIQRKEKRLAELSDLYKVMKYEVTKLHSLQYLEKRKQEMKLDLVLPKEVKVVPLPVQRELKEAVEVPSVVQRGFLSFVNFIKEAQAKTSSSR